MSSTVHAVVECVVCRNQTQIRNMQRYFSPILLNSLESLRTRGTRLSFLFYPTMEKPKDFYNFDRLSFYVSSSVPSQLAPPGTEFDQDTGYSCVDDAALVLALAIPTHSSTEKLSIASSTHDTQNYLVTANPVSQYRTYPNMT